MWHYVYTGGSMERKSDRDYVRNQGKEEYETLINLNQFLNFDELRPL